MDIEITRPKQYTDKFRDYYLWVDDNEIATIKPNSKQQITFPDDSKNIRVTVDWCSSAEFKISNFNSKKLIIKNSFGDNLLKSIFLPLYYITFGKDKYLTIENGI